MSALEAGRNIAIKVPSHRWGETVAFYRERVGLAVAIERDDTVAFEFGQMRLWIDRVEHQSQVDVWLELVTRDVEGAVERLEAPVRDALEPLYGVEGHWISDPAGVVLLLRAED